MAMISSEVQRTLVKSPPELWSELSDPAALAKHLGEFGEIRITRVETERTVEWESEDARGTVLLKASGWGTKVTLSVTRELALEAPRRHPALAPQTAAAIAAEREAERELEREPQPEPEPPEAALQAASDAALQAAPDAALQAAPETALQEVPEAALVPAAPWAAEEPPAVPRRWFFSRLFRRRRSADPALEAEQPLSPPPERAASPQSPSAKTPPPLDSGAPGTHSPTPSIEALQARYLVRASEPAATREAAPVEAIDAAPAPETSDVSAELRAAEEAATERASAVLTAALDRLGAAHHRPFSRS